MMAIFQKVDDGERTVPRIRALMREGGEARPKVELAVGDFNDPASLKPAFASVDEAFVVVNGKDLNRLEANAFDAAKSAGVSHIVKLSGRGVDWPSMHRHGPGAVARRERTPPGGAWSELDDP